MVDSPMAQGGAGIGQIFTMLQQIQVTLGTINKSLGTATSATSSGFSLLNSTISAKFPNWVAAPSASTSGGTAGMVAYDATHFYVCIATNSWVRATLASW